MYKLQLTITQHLDQFLCKAELLSYDGELVATRGITYSIADLGFSETGGDDYFDEITRAAKQFADAIYAGHAAAVAELRDER